MIMTLSQPIYSTLEYRIRTALDEGNKNLSRSTHEEPDYSMGFFQYFSTIHELNIKKKQILILNLKVQLLLILKLLVKGSKKFILELSNGCDKRRYLFPRTRTCSKSPSHLSSGRSLKNPSNSISGFFLFPDK